MDRYFVRRRGSRATGPGQILEEGTNLLPGTSDFRRQLGAPTSLEQDLLIIAAAIFAADRASKRGERENFSRQLSLDVPVVNVARLMPVIKQLEEILYLLSQDGWEVSLRAQAGSPEIVASPKAACGRTLLFSGGLDSLAAAVEFGSEPTMLQLVSHRTRNPVTDTAQKKLAALLTKARFNVTHFQFLLSSRDGGPTNLRHAEENSQRTRSFVFLILGALVARRTGHREIVFLAENGQMAIHLPLTPARAGAFTTHTAHPSVLAGMETLLSSTLGVDIKIRNPYVHKTKKETIEQVVKQLPSAIPITTSCWRSARVTSSATHCGACVPCYVRKIAIESWMKDTTSYERDVWTPGVGLLDPADDGRRNLLDILEFVKRFETQNDADLMAAFPELYSEHVDAPRAIGMYRRFVAEARHVLGHYPNVRKLL